jgi:hypothetical protein
LNSSREWVKADSVRLPVSLVCVVVLQRFALTFTVMVRAVFLRGQAFFFLHVVGLTQLERSLHEAESNSLFGDASFPRTAFASSFLLYIDPGSLCHLQPQRVKSHSEASVC